MATKQFLTDQAGVHLMKKGQQFVAFPFTMDYQPKSDEFLIEVKEGRYKEVTTSELSPVAKRVVVEPNSAWVSGEPKLMEVGDIYSRKNIEYTILSRVPHPIKEGQFIYLVSEREFGTEDYSFSTREVSWRM